MVTAVFLCVMSMSLVAVVAGAGVRHLLATIGTILAVIGSALIDTGIGTGGWLLATVPLAPVIYGVIYLLVYVMQVIADWCGQTKAVAGVVTLTAFMVTPINYALLTLLCSPLIYFALLHSMRLVWQHLADDE